MQEWEETWVDFPAETVALMRRLIDERKKDPNLAAFFVNTILREDIFNILDTCCTVVYYPLDTDEENDGFQVIRPVDYGDRRDVHFVYLNTAKPLEKQVFAAGHELGHIWNIAEEIWRDGTLEEIYPRAGSEEAAMNRFAAELLMPFNTFYNTAMEQISLYRKDGTLTYLSGIRVIANLMNEFCVPARAAGFRLYETGCLSQESCERLLFIGPDSKKITRERYQASFQRALGDCIQEGGYTRLNKATNKKGIKDFPALLNKAEAKGKLSPQRITALRKAWDIPVIDETESGLGAGSLE